MVLSVQFPDRCVQEEVAFPELTQTPVLGSQLEYCFLTEHRAVSNRQSSHTAVSDISSWFPPALEYNLKLFQTDQSLLADRLFLGKPH